MNYDFSKFHPMCANRIVVQGSDGLHVCCLDCGISANMEAISAKVSAADSCLVGKEVKRMPTGDQSQFVDKGEIIK